MVGLCCGQPPLPKKTRRQRNHCGTPKICANANVVKSDGNRYSKQSIILLVNGDLFPWLCCFIVSVAAVPWVFLMFQCCIALRCVLLPPREIYKVWTRAWSHWSQTHPVPVLNPVLIYLTRLMFKKKIHSFWNRYGNPSLSIEVL